MLRRNMVVPREESAIKVQRALFLGQKRLVLATHPQINLILDERHAATHSFQHVNKFCKDVDPYTKYPTWFVNGTEASVLLLCSGIEL